MPQILQFGVWAKPEDRILFVSVGEDTLEIYPADPVRIRELAVKLLEVVEQLKD